MFIVIYFNKDWVLPFWRIYNQKIFRSKIEAEEAAEYTRNQKLIDAEFKVAELKID